MRFIIFLWLILPSISLSARASDSDLKNHYKISFEGWLMPAKFEGETRLNSVVRDQPVYVLGEFPALMRMRLLGALNEANQNRATEEDGAPRLRSIAFRIGEKFGTAVYATDHPINLNSTVSGLSDAPPGETAILFTIPATASAPEIAEYLTLRLPPLYSLPEISFVPEPASRGGFCARLLAWWTGH